MREIENDGFVTPDWELLERTAGDKAVPARECIYPRCEDCEAYVNVSGRCYCTVPIVVSKQMLHAFAELRAAFEKRISFIEEIIEDEYFSPKNARDIGKPEHRIDENQLTWTEEDVIQLGED